MSVRSDDDRGQTHAPLLSADSPIAQMVGELRERGYAGVYDLELEPTRWPGAAVRCREEIERSVATLQRILA